MKHKGRFGIFGGFYVPEVLIPALEEIEAAFDRWSIDPGFVAELDDLYRNYAGRPTPLYHARRFSQRVGCQVYIKREDLLHGGAHKVNNTLGQGLLAKYMGKTKLIAETGAGQHGLATAMIGALFGMETKIFMGATDVRRQNVNVHKMRLCGAEVVPVSGGTGTLKDAINDALRYWTAHVQDTFYLFGTAGGPHPYPSIVKHFQKPIGVEARAQCLSQLGRFRMWLRPASAAAPMRSASSADSSMTRRSALSASRAAAKESPPASIAPHFDGGNGRGFAWGADLYSAG